MLPSVSPVMSSMSFGVMNCWPTILLRMSGNRSSSVSITFSPKASRFASSQSAPPSRWYGAYWTKQLITCLPGGAIVGSTSVGMMQSM